MSDPAIQFERAEPLVRTERLGKVFPDGNVVALDDVNLRISTGEYLAIMGPSGSGKSTLLSLIGGLDVPTAGEVFLQQQSLSQRRDLDRLRSSKIGFVFQSFHLLSTLTAVENVQIPMFETSLKASERAAKAGDLLKSVGMGHRLRHRPSQLSVGERQRVAIARALANDAVLILADEPTGNLDSGTAQEILDLFARLHTGRGVTLLLVTHDEAVARRAGRIVRMLDGRIIEDDATLE